MFLHNLYFPVDFPAGPITFATHCSLLSFIKLITSFVLGFKFSCLIFSLSETGSVSFCEYGGILSFEILSFCVDVGVLSIEAL